MTHNLSRRQYEVLETLRRLAGEHHYMPSVRELGAALQLSPATTQQHLAALRRKGYLTSDGTAHGLRFVGERVHSGLEAALADLEETFTDTRMDETHADASHRLPGDGIGALEADPARPGRLTRRQPLQKRVAQTLAATDDLLRSVAVPIAGTIAAGRPIEAIETRDQTLPVSREMARPGDYLLHVRGDSMIDDGILNGDLVLIRPQPSVENGQIAVGLLEDGTATLKRVYREEGRFRLQPANAAMAPIFVDRLEVQGRVVGLLRTY